MRGSTRLATVAAVSAVLLAAVSVAPSLGSSTVVFSDTFTSGTLSNWAVVTGGSGRAVVQSGVVYPGATYAAHLTSTTSGGSFADVRHALSTPLQAASVTVDAYVGSEGPANYSTPILRAFASDGRLMFSLYRQNQDWSQVWWQDAAGGYHATSALLPLKTWAKFQVTVVVNGGATSTFQVLDNGTPVYTTTTAALGNNWLQAIQLGNQNQDEYLDLYADGVVVAAGTGTASPSPTPTPSSSSSAGIDHVIVVTMENKEYSQITSSSSPYLWSLAQTYGLATNYYAVAHPSESNYVAMTAGQYGAVTDGTTGVTFRSLWDQLGGSWRAYEQDIPWSCYTGSSYSGGVDGPGVAGTYYERHNPATVYADVASGGCSGHVYPLAQFSPTAAKVMFVSPNSCNDEHDCSISTGDAFLKAFVPKVLASSDAAHTLLVITYDEGTTNSGQDGDWGGHVFTALVAPWLRGVKRSTYFDHYSTLRTIEDAFGLPCLGAACTRSPLTPFLP